MQNDHLAAEFHHCKLLCEDLTREITLIKNNISDLGTQQNPQKAIKIELLLNVKEKALEKLQGEYVLLSNQMLEVMKSHFDRTKTVDFKARNNSYFSIELLEDESFKIIGPYLLDRNSE